jgi:hypothetical protein
VKIDGSWEDVKSLVGFAAEAVTTFLPLPLYSPGSTVGGAELGSPYGSVYCYEFPAGLTRDVHTSFRVPQYHAASELQLVVTTPNIASGSVYWQMAALVQQQDSYYLNNAEYTYDIGPTANDEFGDFQTMMLSYTVPDLNEGDVVNLRIIRDGASGSDTLNETAYLLSAAIKIVKTV